MKEWRTAKLGDLVSFKTGKLDSNAAVPNGDYPFFTCSQETLRTNTFSFDTECVLLAGNNANGIYPLKYFHGKFDAYQRTYIVKPRDTNLLTTKFLYYALRPKLSEFRSVSTGAATKFLTLTILNNTEMEVPPMPVQRLAAAVLSAYDDLIENNARRIQILEQMAQALYREWFVHFRFPRHAKVKFVDSSVGKIPQGWEATRVGEVINTLGGGTPSTKNLEYWEGGNINWYSPSDLTAAEAVFVSESSRKITDFGLQESSAKLFPANCVMMTSRATIGVIAMNTTPATTNQGFITSIPNTRLCAYHIIEWIKQNLELIISVASGATFKEISRGEFRDLQIVLPPEPLEREYHRTVDPMYQEIRVLLAKNTNLRRTRDLLLPKLISGVLSIDKLEVAA